MQNIHGSKNICSMHKGGRSVIIASIVQNDGIMGRFIKSMNMVIGAQCDYVIMQLMMGNVIIMYEDAIKKDHNIFANEVHKLIYHG